MKLQTVLFWGALAGAGYLLLKKKDEAGAPSATTVPGGSVITDDAPVLHVVQETLHQHEGEDNPIVHAFEEALEHKSHGSAA